MKNWKMTWRRAVSLLLSASLVLSLMVLPAHASLREPPAEIAECGNIMGSDFKLTFPAGSTDWLAAITDVSVDGAAYSKASTAYGVYTGNYFVNSGSNQRYIVIDDGFAEKTAVCVIRAEGYEALTVKLDRSNAFSYTAEIIPGQVTGPDSGGDGESGEKPDKTAKKIDLSQLKLAEERFSSCWELTAPTEVGYIAAVTGVAVNGAPWSKAVYLAAGGQYKITDDALYLVQSSFDSSRPAVKTGDVITISAAGYEDLTFKLVIDGNGTAEIHPDDGQGDPYQLHVKIEGSFEAAIVGQKGYDAVSGASSAGASSSQNSAVTVYGALVKKGETPAESDWEELGHQSKIDVEGSRSFVSIVPDTEKGTASGSDSGMRGVYAPYSSALELSGTPKTAGRYLVSVTIADAQGRTAVSNTLPFRIYTGEETLADQLSTNNLKQYENGLYAWDIMEPWAIRNFGSNVAGETESVRVPVPLEVWFGSHSEGTYGYLGYDIAWSEVLADRIPQTLYIPDGCHLTLQNMHVLSSVRIVVESGGHLTLLDSCVQGVIDVCGGGTFSMNYDAYSGKFTTGASLCGQLRLADGAILENAAVYSHTNYLANGERADRANDAAVVAVAGAVELRGKVFICGDDAGSTGIGQSALLVKQGTLTLAEDAVLVTYGGSGGDSLLYSDGGTAVQLDNGSITGPGKLVAIGGTVVFGSGGHALSGAGTISTAEVFLQGATAYGEKMPGTAVNGTISVTSGSRHQADGEQMEIGMDDPLAALYWKTGIAAEPPLDRFVTAILGGSMGAGSDTPSEDTPADGDAPVFGGSVLPGSTIQSKREPDGTITTIEIKKDGTVIKTTQTASGTVATTVRDESGSALETTVVLSGKHISSADTVELPVDEVENTRDQSSAARIDIVIPAGSCVTVAIPVRGVTPGTVVVIVNQDGGEQVVSTTQLTKNGVSVTLRDSASIKVVDKAKHFADVPDGSVFSGEIAAMSARNIMVGCSETEFDQNSLVTLDQIANVAGRISGSVDVADFAGGVAWAAAHGFPTGSCPAARSDVLAALYLAVGAPQTADIGQLTRFKDAKNISSELLPVVLWAVESGILMGNEDGTLALDSLATRGQTAAFAGRALGIVS